VPAAGPLGCRPDQQTWPTAPAPYQERIIPQSMAWERIKVQNLNSVPIEYAALSHHQKIKKHKLKHYKLRTTCVNAKKYSFSEI
jgi:hypothetical protein